MKIFFLVLFIIESAWCARDVDAYKFLQKKSHESKRTYISNEYEDIISGTLAFTIGNIGYFTTTSSTLQIAYSGVQTVGIISIGSGIHDFYYPHFESRLLESLRKKKITRAEMANDYVSLLGEMDRAKRLSLLWSSSLLTAQYGLNAFLAKDISSDLKDIYLFMGGVNAIVAAYSYFHRSDYESYYQERQNTAKLGFFILPSTNDQKFGLGLTRSW
jgi:hypothetical protein